MLWLVDSWKATRDKIRIIPRIQSQYEVLGSGRRYPYRHNLRSLVEYFLSYFTFEQYTLEMWDLWFIAGT